MGNVVSLDSVESMKPVLQLPVMSESSCGILTMCVCAKPLGIRMH